MSGRVFCVQHRIVGLFLRAGKAGGKQWCVRRCHGNAIRCFSFHAFDDKPERRLANAQKCFEMIRDGRVKPLVYKDLPLSEARQAHELLDAGKVIGKLIMHP